jgi:hypothetical protein
LLIDTLVGWANVPVALKPEGICWPDGMLLFHDSLVTVTVVLPDGWLYWPCQPLVTRWVPGQVNRNVQPLMLSAVPVPLLRIVTLAPNPPPPDHAWVNVTWQTTAAYAGADAATAPMATTMTPTAAKAVRRLIVLSLMSPAFLADRAEPMGTKGSAGTRPRGGGARIRCCPARTAETGPGARTGGADAAPYEKR